MTSRVLPRAEWSRLAGTELERVVAAANATGHDALVVLVVEDEAGAIVGCWSLLPVWHAEGLWIAPAHRGRAGVGRRLLRCAAQVAEQLGISGAVTTAQSPDIERLLIAHGVPVPGAHYIVPLRTQEKEPCRPPLLFH